MMIPSFINEIFSDSGLGGALLPHNKFLVFCTLESERLDVFMKQREVWQISVTDLSTEFHLPQSRWMWRWKFISILEDYYWLWQEDHKGIPQKKILFPGLMKKNTWKTQRYFNLVKYLFILILKKRALIKSQSQPSFKDIT